MITDWRKLAMNLGRLISSSIVFLLAMDVGGSAFAQYNRSIIKDPEMLHQFACSDVGKRVTPWHISNLYDCESKTIYVPYHLWTGAKWDGNKNAPCMHEASTTFFVNINSKTTITGPREWGGRKIWVRAKSNGSKTQYFECHDRGIGRVYEIRKGKKRYYRETDRCKFPGGHGWEFAKRRNCTRTAIEIDKIEFDKNRELFALEFKWWYESKSRGYVLDHRYRYQPNVGSVNAWPQR